MMKAEISLKGSETKLEKYYVKGDSIVIFGLIHTLLEDILKDNNIESINAIKFMCNDILNKICDKELKEYLEKRNEKLKEEK